MAIVIKDHTTNEDRFLGYDYVESEPCYDLVKFRDNIPFRISNFVNAKDELTRLLSTNCKLDSKGNILTDLPSQDIAIISDIFYILGIPKDFIKVLEIYISNIKFPYNFLDIKIVRIYKKILTKYKIEENEIVYEKILKDDRKCDCVYAIKSAISDRYKKLDTLSLIGVLDLVSNKDKIIILNLLLGKDINPLIFNTNTIYEIGFLKYLAYFLSRDISNFKYLKYKQSKLVNYDLFLDYILTLNIEENRKLVDLSGLFKNFTNDKLDIKFLLVLYNLSRSVYILRSEFVKYPITELLLDILTNTINISKSKESEIDYNFIYQGLETSYKKIILNILTNLLLEFGNYRSIFKSLNGLEIIEEFKNEYPIEILRLYKNYLYDNTISNKKAFLRNGDSWFYTFFDKSNDIILEVLFNLIRNLVCDKIELSDYLIGKIFTHLENSTSHKILIHILYAIGNISANNISFRDLLLQKENVIKRLKGLFNEPEFYLPLLWIIINLSWKDEGVTERIKILNEFKIREELLQIKTSEGVIIDRIQTALENLKE